MDGVVGDHQARVVVAAGARVRDAVCGQIHTLTRPKGAPDSDALLLYECGARDSAERFSSSLFETVHIGAIFGRLVNGLKPAD